MTLDYEKSINFYNQIPVIQCLNTWADGRSIGPQQLEWKPIPSQLVIFIWNYSILLDHTGKDPNSFLLDSMYIFFCLLCIYI